MRNRVFALIVCAAALAAPVVSSGRTTNRSDEQIDKSFELAPGAQVEVSSIAGNVTVETGDSSTADVHVERRAETANGLACTPMRIESTGSRLIIRVEQDKSSECRRARRSEDVRIRLPLSVSLHVSSVAGNVTVGSIDGSLHVSSVSGDVHSAAVGGDLEVSSVSGDVEVGNASGSTNLSSISGTATVGIARLGDRGLTASSISGDVVLRFAPSVSADVHVSSISGELRSDLDNATVTKRGDSSYSARVGAGGAEIEISSISGNVRLDRP